MWTSRQGQHQTILKVSQYLCGKVQDVMIEKTWKQAILKLHVTSEVPAVLTYVVVQHGHSCEE
jgi:hypothetical protein